MAVTEVWFCHKCNSVGFGNSCSCAEEPQERHEQMIKRAVALDRQVGGDHYAKQTIQPIEYIMANGLDFNEGSIIKYITRHKDKGGAQDIEKIKQYCDFILKYQYGK